VRAAPLDYMGKGGRINAVRPGRTRTRPLEAWFQDPVVESHVMAVHAIERLAAAVENARVALFLATPESSS
jgi:NAD(P)-dependent dehydrogenase (short-subunit alcohol dehydrogenase family)